MEKFIFRYASILKMREDEEDSAQNQLAKSITELTLLEKELKRIKEEEKEFNSKVEKRLENGCSLYELRGFENNKIWLKAEIENTISYIVDKEKEVLAKRHELIEATKQKKIMEKLKENDYEDYQKGIKVAEERMTDQIVTYQSTTNKR